MKKSYYIYLICGFAIGVFSTYTLSSIFNLTYRVTDLEMQNIKLRKNLYTSSIYSNEDKDMLESSFNSKCSDRDSLVKIIKKEL